MKYVLITAARDEERLIESTIVSIASQTVLPVRWLIVNDGSTDHTAEIVAKHMANHAWIRKIDLPVRKDRHFGAKASNVNMAFEHLQPLDFDVVGNVDADITVQPDYFEFLLQRFEANSALGVAGTPFAEVAYDSVRNSFEGAAHVAGGCQLFRRQCFEDVGRYVVSKAGGIDWIAVTTARMRGWHTESFRERRFLHHRPLATAERSRLSALYSYGEKDYLLGNHPIWQIGRVGFQVSRRPYLLGAAALLGGYASALFRRPERPVSNELVRFHRKEQLSKLRYMAMALLTLQGIDPFTVSSESISRRRD